MQIRHMERHATPVRLLAIGPVYRRDNLDLTHTPMFHQVEGLVVAKGVTLADLKGQVVVTASNRVGQVYLLPGAKVDVAELARRLDREPAVELTLRREGDEAVARRGGEDFPARELEHPDAAERVRAALANPNAGELLVSAAEGWEFVDLGGRHHQGGGSHGSLVAGDSFVPLLTIGVDASPGRITEVVPAVLRHFEV